MPHRLIVHEAFFNSTDLPDLCIFTGRSGAISNQVLFLRENVGRGFILGNGRYCSFPILLPAAPGRRLMWRFWCEIRRCLTLSSVLLGAVATIYVVLAMVEADYTASQRTTFLAVAVIAALVLSGCILVRHEIARRTTQFHIHSIRGLIAVDFPDRLAETFQVYSDAARAFTAAHNLPEPEVLPGDETWSDAVSSGWDRGRGGP